MKTGQAEAPAQLLQRADNFFSRHQAANSMTIQDDGSDSGDCRRGNAAA